MTIRPTVICAMSLAMARGAAAQGSKAVPPPPFSPGAFRHEPVTNPLFPLVPGTTYVFDLFEDGAKAVDSIIVTNEQKIILGIHATVVIDRVRRNGAMAEETRDWYAQDTLGNVWYLGEDSKEFKNGKVSGTGGSWEAGVKGARPGIMMHAQPKPGISYRQEYLPGVAEDMGRVVSVGDSVTVPAGHYARCVTTEDWSPLEPAIRERKIYCPGVGLVRERTVAGGKDRSDLLSIKKPQD